MSRKIHWLQTGETHKIMQTIHCVDYLVNESTNVKEKYLPTTSVVEVIELVHSVCLSALSRLNRLTDRFPAWECYNHHTIVMNQATL